MLAHYELQSQIGAGADGVLYRALDVRESRPVDVWLLTRREGDAERAKRLRMAAMLAHRTARRVLDLDLDNDPPIVALETVEGPSSARGSLTWRQAVGAAQALAEGIGEAHRLGLVHGRLGPGTIAAVGEASFKVDWTGLVASGADGPPLARADPSADVASLAALLTGWLAGGGVLPEGFEHEHPALASLIAEMTSADPERRPASRMVASRLAAMLMPSSMTVETAGSARDMSRTADLGAGRARGDVDEDDRSLSGGRLGRFLLHEKLGQGGMGAVYRGEDLADGMTVAIKVLRASWARQPESLRRFVKEARLLAEVNNPHVTNLVELNEDGGVHYIALEFVAGESLAQWLMRRGKADERTALAIVADVARGLAFAHERGIVHRDIKPENVLLVGGGPEGGRPPRVKLTDFGLARHVVQSESMNLTRAGAIVGTPLYMAPEQCAGADDVGPPADVYSLGATLFHLLAGRPPFVGDSMIGLIGMHQNQPPPPLGDWNDAASDGVAQIVARALAKRPEARYADASEMLLDLDRLLRGEPTGMVVHPRLPEADPGFVSRFDFRWELDATPAELWPLVSNTERLNRAIGLPAVTFTTESDPGGGSRRSGRFRKAGVSSSWREHPFEWVEGRRMGVLREFTEGPFRWFVSVVELTPRAGGGTTLSHTVRVASHGHLGRAVAAVEIGVRAQRSLEQVYHRIDAALTGKLGRDPTIDPFQPPAELSKERRRRLDAWLESLGTRGVDPMAIERVGDFLARAPAQDVARIRPLALARRLDLDPDQVVAACLHGARDGVLLLLWDILCPICRVPSEVIDTLRALRDHGHCEACRIDYELEFANSVELIFRVHPEVRETELGTYCIGGPAHSPHVAAQTRVAPGERLALDVGLGAGAYRIRGPQLAFSFDFRVAPEARATRLDLNLTRGPSPEIPRALRAGGQVLTFHNESDHELVVRVERTAARDDALTAARASAIALFRTLFPGEVLSPGQLMNLETVTLVVTDLDHRGDFYLELGDPRAFAILHEHFLVLDDCIRRHAGALVKTVNEGTVAVFSDACAAVESALAMAPALAEKEPTDGLSLRVGIHRGPAMVATLNDHLDYFGNTANVAGRLPALAAGGGIVATSAVASDPRVADLLRSRGLSAEVVPAKIAGLRDGFVHRIRR